MLPSERVDIKQKFDSAQPQWDDMYYSADYQSKGLRKRKYSGVELRKRGLRHHGALWRKGNSDCCHAHA